MGRYSEALKIAGNVLKQTKEELITTAFVISIPLVIVSTLIVLS